MALKAAGDLEAELIDALCARIREELPDEPASMVVEFVRQYYHWVPSEDLTGRDPADLYGAALAHWSQARERTPGEAKVRVYNPDRERDGWSSHAHRNRDRLR